MPYQGDNLMSVKRSNRSAALRILHEKGAMSRKRLAESMRLTPAAITKIVGELIEDGLLREGEPLNSGNAGRREILVDLNPHQACGLGILINLRQAIVSGVWLDGEVIFAEDVERIFGKRPWTSRSEELLEAQMRADAERMAEERAKELGLLPESTENPDSPETPETPENTEN